MYIYLVLNLLYNLAQSGLWLGKTDDLWSWGKPQGVGSVFREESVKANTPSDPFLMSGFDKKSLHLSIDKPHEGASVSFAVEVDTLGTAYNTGRWRRLTTIKVAVNESNDEHGYVAYTFPEGFSAYWVRIVPLNDCSMCTATFFYT